MWKEFARRSPKAATVVIYVGGYIAGSLLGSAISYLTTGSVKPVLLTAAGFCCGGLALFVAQRGGLVPEPQDLNKPIRLFEPGGATTGSSRNNTPQPGDHR